jgi:CDP-diacylglycerol--serine O-phosphatidyltransferase
VNLLIGSRKVKKIAIVPTLFTLGNAVCGFAAICLVSRVNAEGGAGYYSIAALCILGAMVFDGLDGFAARLTKTASNFGGQLDSLCDAISFGAAPGFILIRMGFDWETFPLVAQALVVIGTLYMLCAILRLARFNVENSPDPAFHKRFKGLPSPGAAGCIAALALLRGGSNAPWHALHPPVINEFLDYWGVSMASWAPLGGLLVALLMVSRVPYPHATKQILSGHGSLNHLIKILLAVCVIVLVPEIALFAVFWGYALFFLIRYVILRGLRRSVVSMPAAPESYSPHSNRERQ